MSFMPVKVFVDTNVLVYSRDNSEPEKNRPAMDWMKYLWKSRKGRLSFQVLQEFYYTVTTKLKPGMDKQSARDDVESLMAWGPSLIDDDIIRNAWILQDRFGFSWWDSLIVSAAQIMDCHYLLTEDLQQNQLVGDVRVISPFQLSPADLDAEA
jgi:predicted nucleic acid-binding protein